MGRPTSSRATTPAPPSSRSGGRHGASAQLRTDGTAQGEPVRFLRSTIVPKDESCLVLIEAASEALVREAYSRARVRFERISAAIPVEDVAPERKVHEMNEHSMKSTLRLALAAPSRSSRPARSPWVRPPIGRTTHGNRLQITFVETRLSIQEPPGLGMRQTLLSGTGTFEGFGAATELVAVSIDLSVTPCGAGSSTSTILRRVVVPEGILVLKSLAHRCPAPFGIKVIGQYVVDGDASTGIFAGARGRGTDTVEVPGPPPAGPIVTISGKLHLAGEGDDD